MCAWVWGSEAPASRRSLTITWTYAASSACVRMRSRQTPTAALTCSTSRSASDGTGSGALMTTSWRPLAGVAVKRSFLANGGGAVLSGSSAGYRFGTTRTCQPGVSGSLPFGRTAYTSGGVCASWPSRKGSVAGSIGGHGSADRPPPGRVARSGVTIDFRPLNGSTRTSGMRPQGRRRCGAGSPQRLLHHEVLDAGVQEALAIGGVAGALVEGERARLGGEREAARAAVAGLRLGE